MWWQSFYHQIDRICEHLPHLFGLTFRCLTTHQWIWSIPSASNNIIVVSIFVMKKQPIHWIRVVLCNVVQLLWLNVIREWIYCDKNCDSPFNSNVRANAYVRVEWCFSHWGITFTHRHVYCVLIYYIQFVNA